MNTERFCYHQEINYFFKSKWVAVKEFTFYYTDGTIEQVLITLPDPRGTVK